MRTEKLIEEVKKRPVLYDPDDPNYRNFALVDSTWQQIGEIFNVEAEDAKSKWRNVRSNYLREKRMKGGTPHKIKWRYYEAMKFLDNARLKSSVLVHKPTGTRANFGELVEEIDSNSFQTVNDEDIKVGILENSPSEPDHINAEGTNEIASPRSPTTENNIDLMLLAHLSTVAERVQEASDDDLMFLRSLLPNMKKLSALDNMDFRLQVLQLLKKKLEVTESN